MSTADLEASVLAEQYFGEKDFTVLREVYAKYQSMRKKKPQKDILFIQEDKVSTEAQCDMISEEPQGQISPIKEESASNGSNSDWVQFYLKGNSGENQVNLFKRKFSEFRRL